MNKTMTTGIITSIVGVILTAYCRFESQSEWQLAVGMLGLLFLFGLGTVAGVICFWKRLMPVGQGLFVGIGVTILIGFSICTFT